MFKVKKFLFFGGLMSVRQRQWDFFTAICFGLIECTPVTHVLMFVVVTHLISTFAGAFGFFISMTHTYKKWSKWWWVFLVFAVLGALGFLIGVLPILYSTAKGEWIFALFAIAWVLVTNSGKIGQWKV